MDGGGVIHGAVALKGTNLSFESPRSLLVPFLPSFLPSFLPPDQ